ncbi:MAG: hypothetical protein AAGB00_07180 [Planctomycetota bacterium]
MSRLILSSLAAAAVLAVAPQVAEAGCGGYGGGYYRGGHRATYARRYAAPVYHAPVVHRPVIVHKPVAPVVVQKPVYVAPLAEHCYHPQHCHAWVLPGESLDAICLREYGDASLWRRVAEYNRCSSLVVGQKLLLPSIYANGRMIPSPAPAPGTPLAAPPIAAAPVAALATPPAAPAG